MADSLTVIPAEGRYRQKTVDGALYNPNAFGLYDMHGNVWEWVDDCYNASYSGAPADGSAWTTGDCLSRVVRGGAWYNPPGDIRSAQRSSSPPGTVYDGFRLARTLNP